MCQEPSPMSPFVVVAKNANTLKEITKEFQGKGLDKLLETCMFANMTEIEQREYISHMKAEWDREGQLDYAESRGVTKGIEQTARAMKAEGMPSTIIAKCTGLTPEQIETL